MRVTAWKVPIKMSREHINGIGEEEPAKDIPSGLSNTDY